jgi:translation initiation factor IF-2
VYRGKAEVRDTFRITKVGNVAGCIVMDGVITRDSEVRLLRDNVVVHTGKIGSLRRFKDDVSEVKSGMECGITLDELQRCQAGRRDRSLQDRARGQRSRVKSWLR